MNPYRNENEAIQMKVEALNIENNDLRQQLEQLQSLFDNNNNAIVMCPIENDDDVEPSPKDETVRKIAVILNLLQGLVFFSLIIGYFTVDPDYFYAVILSAFFINVCTVLIFLYSRQSWR